MKYLRYAMLIGLVLLLAACGLRESEQANIPATATTPVIQPTATPDQIAWTTQPDALILRVDRYPNEPDPIDAASQIPPCTLWGDGHLVWVNQLEERREILEARLTPDEMHDLLASVIETDMLNWQSDYTFPGAANPVIRRIELHLAEQQKLVERFDHWTGYQHILDLCQQAATMRVLFLPDGGWLSATEVPRPENVSTLRWDAEASGVSLATLATGDPQWITGDLARAVWDQVIQQDGQPYFLEDGSAYRLAIQVPGYSRQSPPPPDANLSETDEE